MMAMRSTVAAVRNMDMLTYNIVIGYSILERRVCVAQTVHRSLKISRLAPLSKDNIYL